MNDQAEGCHNVESDEIMTLVNDSNTEWNSAVLTARVVGPQEMNFGTTCLASIILGKSKRSQDFGNRHACLD
jgi:hypothetical protein